MSVPETTQADQTAPGVSCLEQLQAMIAAGGRPPISDTLEFSLTEVLFYGTQRTIFFHVMAAMAEMERDLVRERTVAGLAAAKARDAWVVAQPN